MQDNLNEKHTHWTKNPYVWLIISLPLTAVIAGIITIRLAIISDDGLVKDDYYKAGLEINRVLERDQAAEALGIRVSINLDGEAGEARLLLTGNENFNNPQQLNVAFLNATRKGMDQEIQMERINESTYQAPLPELPVGHWYVQIEADNWRVLESVVTN